MALRQRLLPALAGVRARADLARRCFTGVQAPWSSKARLALLEERHYDLTPLDPEDCVFILDLCRPLRLLSTTHFAAPGTPDAADAVLPESEESPSEEFVACALALHASGGLRSLSLRELLALLEVVTPEVDATSGTSSLSSEGTGAVSFDPSALASWEAVNSGLGAALASEVSFRMLAVPPARVFDTVRRLLALCRTNQAARHWPRRWLDALCTAAAAGLLSPRDGIAALRSCPSHVALTELVLDGLPGQGSADSPGAAGQELAVDSLFPLTAAGFAEFFAFAGGVGVALQAEDNYSALHPRGAAASSGTDDGEGPRTLRRFLPWLSRQARRLLSRAVPPLEAPKGPRSASALLLRPPTTPCPASQFAVDAEGVAAAAEALSSLGLVDDVALLLFRLGVAAAKDATPPQWRRMAVAAVAAKCSNDRVCRSIVARARALLLATAAGADNPEGASSQSAGNSAAPFRFSTHGATYASGPSDDDAGLTATEVAAVCTVCGAWPAHAAPAIVSNATVRSRLSDAVAAAIGGATAADCKTLLEALPAVPPVAVLCWPSLLARADAVAAEGRMWADINLLLPPLIKARAVTPRLLAMVTDMAPRCAPQMWKEPALLTLSLVASPPCHDTQRAACIALATRLTAFVAEMSTREAVRALRCLTLAGVYHRTFVFEVLRAAGPRLAAEGTGLELAVVAEAMGVFEHRDAALTAQLQARALRLADELLVGPASLRSPRQGNAVSTET